jgi:hypothetical protein
MPFFVVNYDYGTGSAYVGVIADDAAQIARELKYTTVVDPDEQGLDAKLVERLRAEAVPIHDSSWDDVRRPKP